MIGTTVLRYFSVLYYCNCIPTRSYCACPPKGMQIGPHIRSKHGETSPSEHFYSTPRPENSCSVQSTLRKHTRKPANQPAIVLPFRQRRLNRMPLWHVSRHAHELPLTLDSLQTLLVTVFHHSDVVLHQHCIVDIHATIPLALTSASAQSFGVNPGRTAESAKILPKHHNILGF